MLFCPQEEDIPPEKRRENLLGFLVFFRGDLWLGHCMSQFQNKNKRTCLTYAPGIPNSFKKLNASPLG
jgi:hypothetical protein